MVGVVLFLIELGINKFCVLSDERFFRRYGMVICCQKCCSLLSCVVRVRGNVLVGVVSLGWKV